jgi:hypothetical protein
MANEFIVRKGIVVSGASQQSLRTVGNGNILIGSGSTDLGSTLSVIGSSLMSGNTSGSTLLNVVGSQGQLFSVVDTLTGSLMSVNDISGLPILEVFSDDRVVMGEYATNALVVSGRSTGFGVTPSDANYRIISSGSTLFSGGTMIVKGSGTTSGSTAFVVQNSTGGTLLNLFNNGNLNIDNGALYVNGDNGWVGIGTTASTAPLHVIFNGGVTSGINIDSTVNTVNHISFMRSGISYGNLGINASSGEFRWNSNLTYFPTIYSSGSEAMRISTARNVLIGTTTDAGYKLDVNGTFRAVVGTETNPFRLEHTNGNYMTMIVGAGSALAAGQFGMYFNDTPMWSWNGAIFRLHGNTLSTASNPSTLVLQGGYGGSTVGTSIKLSSNTPNQGQWTATGGTQTTVEIGAHSNEIWAPSSGNASYNLLSISPVINTTGTYSGTVRGLYYNPTLTSLSGTTHRAIETTSGNVIFNGGNVGIGTTNPTTKLHVVGNEYAFNAETTSDINFYTTPGVSRHFNFYNIRQDADFNFKQNVGGAVGTSTLIIKGLSGNVLINTTTDAGYKLDVNGTARLNSTTLIEGPLTVNFGGVVGGTSIVANGNTIHNGGRGIYTTGYAYGIQANQTMVGNWSSQPNAAGVHGTGQIGVFGSGDIAGFSGPSAFFTVLDGNNRVSARSYISTFQIRGSGSTELTNTLLLENSSGIKTFTVNDNGNVLIGLSGSTGQKLQVSGTSLFTGTLTNLSGGSSGQLFSMDLSQSAVTGNTIYAINVSPTLRNTASGQTQVALRVMPTFTGSSTGTSTTNKIVDFGSQNVGTQFTVTDATTGDIYMVNDVSGLPIIAANSSWDVSMYNYPNTVFKKTNNSILLGVQNNTGSTVSIYGDLIINEGFGFTNTTTQVSGTTSTGATSAVTIYTLTTSTNKSYSVSCLTTGYGTSTRNTTSGKVEGTFKNSGGTLSMVGTTIQYVSADIVSTNVDFELSGSSIVLRVTGTTTENYTWGSTITSQVI